MNTKVKKFTEEIDKLPDNLSLFNLACQVRAIQHKIYGKNKRPAKTFAESRFSSLNHIFKQGLTSCGSTSTVMGYALARHGYTLKYVHGKIIGAPDSHRHAWLKVYDKNKKRWVMLDATRKDFGVLPKTRKKKLYNNWKELKPDYLNGDY